MKRIRQLWCGLRPLGHDWGPWKREAVLAFRWCKDCEKGQVKPAN